MVKEIEVEPVTRLEGHGGLRIVIGDDGKVKDAHNIGLRRTSRKIESK
jgi:coenzyme F420-reducing hydrogenase alpha subunit